MRPPRWLIEVVETLGLTLITFVVIQSFVAQPFQVRQTSMERTLEPDEYVLVDKLTTRFDPFHRGDIVVLHPPEGWADEQGTPFIKRVIGLPGEVVELRGGRLLVDGERVPEPYLRGPVDRRDFGPVEVPADSLFVLGDNRLNSNDSRFGLGFVPVDEVIGRAFVIIWPPSRAGWVR
jgi:signal peptidase I